MASYFGSLSPPLLLPSSIRSRQTEGLVRPLASIRDWAEQHIEELQAANDAYKRERSLPVEDN